MADVEIASDLVPLPSRGMLYEEGHPLYNEENVEIKAPGPDEEDILTSEAYIKKGTVTDHLIRSCLINKSIDPDELVAGDRNAILFAIRILGFGPEYKVKLKCPTCFSDFIHEFMLNKVEIKSIPEDSGQIENKNLFPIVLPVSKKEVLFKILTSKDEKAIMEEQEKRKTALAKQGKTIEKENKVSARLIKAIKQANGKTDLEDIVNFVKRLNIKDSRAIRKRMSEVAPDLISKQDAKCKFCSKTDIFNIPMTLEFFWPELD